MTGTALSGRDLYGFLQLRKVRIIGIDPNLLRTVPFDLESLRGKIIESGARAIFFPVSIGRGQIKDVFSTTGTPDVFPSAKKLTVSLLPLESVQCPVVGSGQTIDRILVTRSAAEVLSRTPLVLIGEDSDPAIFEQTERLRQIVDAGPLVLGTRFTLDDPKHGLELCRDTGVIFSLLADHSGRFNSPRPLLSRLAKLFTDGFEAELIPLLGRIPAMLPETELIFFIKAMAAENNLEAVACLEEVLEKPGLKTINYLIDLYVGCGNYQAASALLKKATPDKSLKRLSRSIESAEEADNLRRAMAIFFRLANGEIAGGEFDDTLPEHLRPYVEDHLRRNVNPETYETLRKHYDHSRLIGGWLRDMIDMLYLKVREGSLPTGGAQHSVLGLVLRDAEYEFVPSPDSMTVYERKAYLKGRTYFPAKDIYDRFFLADYLKAQDAAVNGNYELAWQHFQVCGENHPRNEILKSDISNFFLNWALAESDAGRADECEKKLLRSLDFNANNINALGLLANYYVEQNRISEFLDIAGRLVRLTPREAASLNLLGFAYYEKYRAEGAPSDLVEAGKWLRESEKLAPRDPRILFNLALLSIEAGKLEEAGRYFGLRLGFDRNFRVVFGFFRALLTSKRIASYDKQGLARMLGTVGLSGQEPQSMVVFIHIVATLKDHGYEEAAEELLVKLERAGLAEIAGFARGLDRFKNGRHAEAVETLRPVIGSGRSLLVHNDYLGERIPLSDDAANLYLVALSNVDLTKAIREGEAMLAGDPSAVIINTVANLYEEVNDRRAAELYLTAHAKQPLFMLPLVNLLGVYRRLGDADNYKGTAALIKCTLEQAVAEGRNAQFDYGSIYCSLIGEHRATTEPEIGETLDLLQAKFPDTYDQALADYERGEKK